MFLNKPSGGLNTFLLHGKGSSAVFRFRKFNDTIINNFASKYKGKWENNFNKLKRYRNKSLVRLAKTRYFFVWFLSI